MRLLALAWLLVATPWLVAADDKKPDAKKEVEVEFNEKLQMELTDLVKADQDLHKELLKNPQKPDPVLLKKLQDQDRKNTLRLKEIVRMYGWPTPKLVGDDGTVAAYGLLQNAINDRAFQKQCLELMKESAKKGDIQQQYVAALTDCLLVLENKKQKYGTQFKPNAKGELVLHPIEDEANVDKRREELGLPKLAEYLKIVKTQLKK